MQWIEYNIDLKRAKRVAIGLAAFFLLLVIAGAWNGARAEGIAKKGAVQQAQAVEAPTWTGCYASVNLGYATQSTEVAGISFDAKDVTYGVGAGCDIELKGTNVVVGVMGDVDWTQAESVIASYDRSWFGGARAGLKLSPSTLFYGLVGYTSLDGSAPVALPFSTDHKGLTIGAGLETMIAANWSLKAEYRHVDLGSDLGGMVEHSQHAARLGLSYRFGAQPVKWFGN